MCKLELPMSSVCSYASTLLTHMSLHRTAKLDERSADISGEQPVPLLVAGAGIIHERRSSHPEPSQYGRRFAGNGVGAEGGIADHAPFGPQQGYGQAARARRKRKNSTPSRSRRFIMSQSVSISRTISQIFDGRK